MSEFTIKYAKLLDSEVEKVVEVLTNRGYKPYFPSGETVLQQVKNWFDYDGNPINLFIQPTEKEFGYCSNLDYHTDNEVIIIDNASRLEPTLDYYEKGYFEGLTNIELSDKYSDVFTDVEGVSQPYHHGKDWSDISDKVPFSKPIDISNLSLDELEDLKEDIENLIDELNNPKQALKLVLVDVRRDTTRTKTNLDYVVAVLNEERNTIYFREEDMCDNFYVSTSANKLREKYILPETLKNTETYVGFNTELSDITILGEVEE